MAITPLSRRVARALNLLFALSLLVAVLAAIVTKRGPAAIAHRSPAGSQTPIATYAPGRGRFSGYYQVVASELCASSAIACSTAAPADPSDSDGTLALPGQARARLTHAVLQSDPTC